MEQGWAPDLSRHKRFLPLNNLLKPPLEDLFMVLSINLHNRYLPVPLLDPISLNLQLSGKKQCAFYL